MNLEIFSIDNFNVIEDEENYYFFRALEPYDLMDEKNNKIKKSDICFDKLRTCRERYNEEHVISSRYSENDEISLDEVYSHIKKNFYPGTNCISFSTNCNVSLDYGNKIDKYVMISVPKNRKTSVYSAGQYMLKELNDYLENILSKLSKEDKIINVIRELEHVDNNDKIMEIINNSIKEYDYKEIDNLSYRFQKRQFFNEQQQLEYNKIIGKLTLLEISKTVKNVLPRTKGNKSLVSTIAMAYSSGEVINYGDSFPSEIKEVSKVTIQLFALLQQAEDKGLDKNKICILKKKVLECAKQGFDLKEYEQKIGYGNNQVYVPFNPTLSSIMLNEKRIPLDKEISIEEVYKITEGRIPYNKAKRALNFALNLGLEKEKTYEMCELLKCIVNDSNFENIINEINDKCCSINANIINRRNFSGIKVCESVNLDMNITNEKIFSMNEQQQMISYIEQMSRDNLRDLLWSNGLSIEKNLCEKILESKDKKTINRYYSEYVVSQIDFENIYGEDRKILEVDKEIIISKLNEGNCVNLYNYFKKRDFSDEIISKYIINLLIDDGFKEYNFKDLSNLEDIGSILDKNITNLSNNIYAIRLDKLLGIIDNQNHIEETSINLRDYQRDTVDNIDAIFETKRFAGAILPTGAGKSFIAMTEMLKYKNKNILYYAPNTEILNQITKHILKNILHLSKEEIQKLYDLKEPILEGSFLPRNIEAIIKIKFPYLKLYCYQGLTKKDENFFEERDADLIIFDELHRAGANEWNKKIKTLIRTNPRAKLLGITATPIRDVDKQDMMLEFAKLSGDYNKRELIQKNYLSSELDLIDAMQEGIIVVPNLVSFDYTLEHTDQYKEIKTMYEVEKDPIQKEKIKKIYDEMRSIVEVSKKQGLSTIIKESFELNKKRKNGRYIVFLPMNNDSNSITEDYIKMEIEKVKEYFSLIDDNPEVGYLLSNRENSNENIVSMSNFEKESEHLKLIFAINMLNEGVHVDGIDGIVMLRPIGANSKILYKQQIGRCLHALDPNKLLNEDEVPIIFDIYNNYLEQNMDREVNKTNTTSDLQKMRFAIFWIAKHKNYFPDINSDDKVEYRKALTLKKIQLKYEKYINGDLLGNLSLMEQYEIEEIISLGKSIKLWDRIIPDREKREVPEESVKRIETFKATGETKRFLELYKSVAVNNQSKVKVGSLRIRTAISILDLLSEYGININNVTIQENTILDDIIKILPRGILNIVKEELESMSIDYNYPLGVEYNFVKQMFCTQNPVFLDYSIRTLRNAGIFHEFVNDKGEVVQSIDSRGFIVKGRKEYRNINIYTGTYYDVNELDINSFDELHFKDGIGVYNKYGFDRDGIHMKTKTRFNRYGFDIYCNYYKLNSDGIYEELGKYNEDGFDIDGLWYKEKINKKTGEVSRVYTGKLVDENGYNIDGINKYNFGRDGYYYLKDSDDNYVNTGEKIDKYGFNNDGIHLNGTNYDDYGFDRDGVHLNGTKYDSYKFDRNGIHKNKTKYDYYGFDRDGYFGYEKLKYNERGFDRDGYYWIMLEDGTREKTNEKYNESGFDIDKKHKLTKLKFNEYGKDEYGNILSNLPKGFFDRDGYYWELIVEKSYKKTNSLYGKEGFYQDGHYWELIIEQSYKQTGSIYGKYGFNRDGVHKNGTKYDDYKFDCNGIHAITNTKYDNYGFNRDGIHIATNKKYDEFEFDRDRIHKNGTKYDDYGFNRDGVHKNGTKYDSYKFDRNGIHAIRKTKYDNYGFNRDGIHIVTNQKYDEFDFDRDRIHKNGTPFDKYEFDQNGVHKNGTKYDDYKFDRDGIHIVTKTKYDNYGFDQNGFFHKSNKSEEKCNLYNIRGFDRDGYYWEKQIDGTYIKTDKMFDLQGFDRDGYYWEKQIDGTYAKTDKKVTSNGIDIWGFDINGIHIETHLNYNSYGFKKDGINIYTNNKYDVNGFDINGIHMNSGMYCNYSGFDRDGIHIVTNTKYDENNLDIYRNKPFDLSNTKYLPYEVFIIKKLLDDKLLFKGIPKEFYQMIAKRYSLKKVSECEIKIGEIMFIAFQLCPELKEILSKQLFSLSSMIINKKCQLKKLNSDIDENKEKIERLEKEIKYYEGKVTKFSIY